MTVEKKEERRRDRVGKEKTERGEREEEKRRNNREGNTRERKGNTKQGWKERNGRAKGREKERLHSEAENTAPLSSSPLQNQVCALPFSVPAIEMMHVSM